MQTCSSPVKYQVNRHLTCINVKGLDATLVLFVSFILNPFSCIRKESEFKVSL